MNEIMLPQTSDLKSRGSEILEAAKAIVIKTSEDNERAAAFLKSTKALANEIEARFAPAKEAAHKAHKAITTMEKEHIEPLKQAETIVKKAINSFLLVEEQKRIKAQEKLNSNAEKKGEIAPVVQEIERPAGITQVEVWVAEVTDLMALVKAVGSGKIPLTYLEPNKALIDQQARVLKAELRLPGVKVTPIKRIVARVG